MPAVSTQPALRSVAFERSVSSELRADVGALSCTLVRNPRAPPSHCVAAALAVSVSEMVAAALADESTRRCRSAW
jgi:hypothetical protein